MSAKEKNPPIARRGVLDGNYAKFFLNFPWWAGTETLAFGGRVCYIAAFQAGGLVKLLALVPALFAFALPAFAASDFLATAIVPITSYHASDVLDSLVGNPKAVFQHYQPALDSGSTIVRPVQVTGTATHPIMQVSIKKCVVFICQTVDLDADITIHEGKQAGCDRAFQLTADLGRSSDLVRNTYNSLDILVCFKASPDGRGTLNLSASAVQAAAYSQGFVQQQMFNMLQLQVQPIVAAVNAVIKQ